MNKGQIETMLRSEAAFGHSPNERTAQIPSIIKKSSGELQGIKTANAVAAADRPDRLVKIYQCDHHKR